MLRTLDASDAVEQQKHMLKIPGFTYRQLPHFPNYCLIRLKPRKTTDSSCLLTAESRFPPCSSSLVMQLAAARNRVEAPSIVQTGMNARAYNTWNKYIRVPWGLREYRLLSRVLPLPGPGTIGCPNMPRMATSTLDIPDHGFLSSTSWSYHIGCLRAGSHLYLLMISIQAHPAWTRASTMHLRLELHIGMDSQAINYIPFPVQCRQNRSWNSIG